MDINTNKNLSSVFSFNKGYFFLAVVMFLIEVLIALFVHDQVVRPYIGDLLVVILIYCFIKAFANIDTVPLAIAVLIFSYLVEILQYFKLVKLLGLQRSMIATIILGNSFEWIDLIAYTAGIVLVVIVESRIRKAPTGKS